MKSIPKNLGGRRIPHTFISTRHQIWPETFEKGKKTRRPNIRNVTAILAGSYLSINDIHISMEPNQSCYLIRMGILKDSLVLSNKLQDSLSWCFIYFLHLSSHPLYMHERAGLERLSGEYVSILSCKTPLRSGGKVSRWKIFRWRCCTSKRPSW